MFLCIFIHLCKTSVVKEALSNFEHPSSGIRVRDIADALAAQFDISDEQVNARHRRGYKIWANHVNTDAKDLYYDSKICDTLRSKRRKRTSSW